MRFSVETHILADALTYVGKAIPVRAPVPVLAGVLLTATPAALTVAAFDYEQSRSVDVAANTDAVGRALVNHKQLAECVKHLGRKARPVTFTLDGGALVLTCGPVRFSIPTMLIEDYPTLPDMSPTVGTVDATLFAATVAAVAVAAGRDDTLPAMTGLHITSEGARMSVEATDRYRLGIRDIEWSPNASGALDLLVPAKTLAEYVKRFAKVGGTVTVGCDANLQAASFVCGAYRLHIRLLYGTSFPKVRGLVPDTFASESTVTAPELAAAVKRMSAALDKNMPVRLTFGDDSVTVAAGDSSETLPCEYAGDKITIGIQPTYLTEALLSFGSAQVRLAFNTAHKPVTIFPADGAGVTVPGSVHLIMPIRLT